MQSTAKSFLREELSAVVSALIGGATYGVKIRLPHALVMTCLFRKDLSSKQKIYTILNLVYEHASNLAAFATIYKLVLAALKGSSRCLRQGVGPCDNPNNQTQIASHGLIKSLGRSLVALVVDGPFFYVANQTTRGASLRKIKPGEPERPYHSLVAGATGGYLVWGRYSSVNYQIVLYLASRILIGLAKRGWEHVYEKPGHFRNVNSVGSVLQHPRTYPLLAATVW
eukprot:CAMPEP_0172362202 /NCGR_PEP_ID=MMETSP1060-20121228/5868_1 /TAXON_ID=37318 /ORGANISM="Pseudo-nitzschia pungens, Strain cf. cingulata" /LENGTH=225 /DNA_ID=CAMNT_0013084653 /DNA_START=102 /DNA_END=776 /DNA_ORIENTATION=+